MYYNVANAIYQQLMSISPQTNGTYNMLMPPIGYQAVAATVAGQYSGSFENPVRANAPSPASCDSAASSPTLELIQMNGRKVLGPPEDWVGPPPDCVCELFVRCIPKDLNEHKLLAPFLRFGRIYEIRLPMDFNHSFRGYAYIKYTNEEDAARAMEVMNHYFISPGRKLEITHSYEKCRLFINNIPKNLTEQEIEEKMRTIFPTMKKISIRRCLEYGLNATMSSTSTGHGNSGQIFVHFPTHLHALQAKKNITPGLIRMWGRDLKVVWANTDWENNEPMPNAKTLFLRNIDLASNNRDLMDFCAKFVPRSDVRRTSKVRNAVFCEFVTRDAAEICLKQMQGVLFRGRRIDVEWAKPSDQQSLHNIRDTDFDAVLRLKCIANGWHIPVIIFGCYYEHERIQYGVVVLRDDAGNMRATFCILNTSELVDIHARLCEVVCTLIETIGTFPDYDYVFMVDKDMAHLLGMVNHTDLTLEFMAAHGVPAEFYLDLNEIFDLSWAVQSLAYTTENALLTAYQESLRTNNDCTYLKNWNLIGHRIFGTIIPNYRHKPPLKYNLNDTQIVLVLCFKLTGTNSSIPSRPFQPFAAYVFGQRYEVLRYITLKLLPVAVTQSRFLTTNQNLKQIQFGGSQYYHPTERKMLPPLWIPGCSYAESIMQSKGLLAGEQNNGNEPLLQNYQMLQQKQINLNMLPAAIHCHQQAVVPPPAFYFNALQPSSVLMPLTNNPSVNGTHTMLGNNVASAANFITHPNMRMANMPGFAMVP